MVKQQTDKDTFDTMDARHASIRWFTGADIGFAIGPSHVYPRTGEILDEDIGIECRLDASSRRGARDVPRRSPKTWGQLRSGKLDANDAYPLLAQKGFLACNYGAAAEQETEFAFDLLEARGLDMDGPEASELAKDYVKDVIMHEVGHTLGLRHNFVASKVYTLKQLSDQIVSRGANGLTSSVMDYNAVQHLAHGGRASKDEHVMSTLGSVRLLGPSSNAYREMDAATEPAELAKIASRSTEPLLAFATDEDAGAGKFFIGIDPDVNRFDLGADPLDYYKRRMKLSRELWDRLQNMKLQPGESYERLTRSFVSGFAQVARIAPLAVKYVGGVTTHRDRAGSGRQLFEPTAAARQKEALALVTNDFFTVDSFRFRPEFLGRLALDQFQRPTNPDISLSATVFVVQKAMLDEMMSDPVATRLLDAPEKAPDASKLLHLSDLYDTLQSSIGAELKSGRDITMIRRNLQREDLRLMTAMLLHPAPTTPPDARSLMRMNAQGLVADLKGAQGKTGYSARRRRISPKASTRCRKRSRRRCSARGSAGVTARRRVAEEVSFRPVDNVRLAALCGPVDAHLRQIETALDVHISRHGERFAVPGAEGKGTTGGERLRRFYNQAARDLTVEDIQLGLVEITVHARSKPAAESPALVIPRHGPHGTHGAPVAIPAADALQRHHVLRGTRRHRQDVPRSGGCSRCA